jgi:branched-chain amino acid aminotransferase
MMVFLDGQFVPEAEAALSINDRGFLFADGVFETALIHDGGCFRLGPHLDRLADSASALLLPPPPADLAAIIRELARRNGLRDANVRVTYTRGAGTGPTLLVTVRPAQDHAAVRSRGWSVITARTRRPSPAAIPAHVKALGRTYALLARAEATRAGADDALLLSDDGWICEGPAWNVFWRTGGTLFTPSLDIGVLAGVTRAVLVELASAAGLGVREGRWDRGALDAADEIFATMTSAGIVPFRTLDGRDLPPHTPAADVLQPAYWSRVGEEAAADPL